MLMLRSALALCALQAIAAGTPVAAQHGQLTFSAPSDESIAPVLVAYCLPGQPCFPSSHNLAHFNHSIHGRLLMPTPPAFPCYGGLGYNKTRCQEAVDSYAEPHWRADNPGAVQYTNWNGNGTADTCPIPANTDGSMPASLCKQGQTAAYVVQVQNERDVVRAVKFAAKYRLRLRIRNTGHDYLSRSSADGSFTISTHHLRENRIVDDWKPHGHHGKVKPEKVLVAQPGLYVEDVYKMASENGVTLVGGASPTVGATGGFLLGGGHGPLGKLFGLGVDNVLQMRVVTADGEVVTANRFENTDLFWALRGGGAAFGVVTEVVVRVHPKMKGLAAVTGQITADTPELYASLVSKWLLANRQLDEVHGAGYNYFSSPEKKIVFAHFLPVPADSDVKDTAQAEVILKSAYDDVEKLLEDHAGHVVMNATWETNDDWYNFWKGPFDAAMGSLDSVAINLLLSSRLVSNATMYGDAELQQLSTAIAGSPIPVLGHFLMGGVIPSVNQDATSIHPAWRKAIMMLEPVVAWPNNAPSSTVAAYTNLLQRVTDTLGAVSGFAGLEQASYSNEANPNEPNWQNVFWGKEHYARLLAIKKKYDPAGVFTCSRCVGSEIYGS